MRINLNDMLIFGIIVKEGSLKNASLKLSIPISTISRRLKELESNMNRKLLHRDNKKILLTPLGETLFHECFPQLLSINEKLIQCIEFDSDMSGRINISAPQGLYNDLFYNKLLDFQKINPKVILDVELTSKPITNNKDIVICNDVETYLYPDFRVKKIRTIDLLLCASPNFLSLAKLLSPEDILKYKTISCPPHKAWSFWRDIDHENKVITPKSSFYVDTFELAKKMTLDSFGLCLLPGPLVKNELRELKLTHCLPDWVSSRVSYSLLYPNRDIIPYRVQMLIRWLTQDEIVK